jgi:hypothetical protein
MRYSFLLWLLLLTVPLHAQDDATPYEIALQRIVEAHQTNAERLYLGLQGLTELPLEIGQLSNLQELNLELSQLTTLPPEIGQLSNLQVLDLELNQLTTLPPEIGQLSNLQILNLYGNQLTTLPPEIGQLSKLNYLSLSRNQLTVLPPEIGQLTNLRVLYLENNQLTSLPPEIGQLSSLCILYLEGNNLRHLPTALGNLTLLAERTACDAQYGRDNGVYLDGNPLISPPPEVVEQGTGAVLEYLRNQAWYHVQRLIVAAASGVGLLVVLLLSMRYRQTRRKPKAKRG